MIMISLAGCGPSLVQVKGRVTRNGAPLVVSDRGRVTVVFHPVNEESSSSGVSYSAIAKPDGTFEVTGKDGSGIPPGSYRIAVIQFDPYPRKDLLKGAFGAGKSPIIREASPVMEIDLDKPGS